VPGPRRTALHRGHHPGRLPAARWRRTSALNAASQQVVIREHGREVAWRSLRGLKERYELAPRRHHHRRALVAADPAGRVATSPTAAARQAIDPESMRPPPSCGMEVTSKPQVVEEAEAEFAPGRTGPCSAAEAATDGPSGCQRQEQAPPCPEPPARSCQQRWQGRAGAPWPSCATCSSKRRPAPRRSAKAERDGNLEEAPGLQYETSAWRAQSPPRPLGRPSFQGRPAGPASPAA